MSATPQLAVISPQQAPAAAGHPLPASFGHSLKRMSPAVQSELTTDSGPDSPRPLQRHSPATSPDANVSGKDMGLVRGPQNPVLSSSRSGIEAAAIKPHENRTNGGNNPRRAHNGSLERNSATRGSPGEPSAIDDNDTGSDIDTGDTADATEPYPAKSDLQFAKKDYRLRTQLFQSVLSSASLKLLKAQSMQPAPVARGTAPYASSNSKNFQLFIQAPVLLATLRRNDDVAIGQQMPFVRPAASEGTPRGAKPVGEEVDEYCEQTTLQQQRLTLNALKKLSLSLAPIIYDNEDENLRQLTTRQLNPAREEDHEADAQEAGEDDTEAADTNIVTDSGPADAEMSGRAARPYQPAQVDLSSFASLTRQSKHLDDKPTTVDRQPQVEHPSAQEHPVEPQRQPPQRQTVPHQRPAQYGRSQAAVTQQGFHDQDPNRYEQAPKPPLSQAPLQVRLQLQAHPIMSAASSSAASMPAKPSGPFPNASASIPSHTLHTRQSRGVMLPRTAGVQSEPLTLKQPVPDRKVQQIKGFRSPMYVPAVLRRTMDDDPAVAAEVEESPERTAAASPNLVASTELQYSTDSARGSALSAGPYVLAQRQHEYIVRAAPTRRHWLRDETVVECGAAACHKRFNFFERRHHCRKCGGIFCKEHTLHFLYINHLAQFTTGGRGTLSRVCDGCIERYNDFIQHEFGTGNAPVLPPAAAEVPVRRDAASPRREVLVKQVPRDDTRSEPVVGSVPANWSWSSF